MDTNKMYYRIRNIAGFLGMILPWIALFSSYIRPHPSATWFYSISATYYQSPALAGILTAASIVLMCYDGYDIIDNIVTTASGVFGICIVLFPCKVDWLSGNVGFFQLPMEISNIIHCGSAFGFFGLLSVNSLFLFTKGDDSPTPQKKIRNIVYRVCGIGMIVDTVAFIVVMNITGKGWVMMIGEIILLTLFGISWLTKGGVFFKDKK